jgi:hypothetical protein
MPKIRAAQHVHRGFAALLQDVFHGRRLTGGGFYSGGALAVQFGLRLLP